ncbi:hypothetical protein [Bacillus sp. SRB_331]|uniref:hypothetical protein n=1 Tax=Bacillus sp. SRB_331 TaxID=1969379 RepID=UPI000DC2EBB1|nr:hypothetical protein [Bacillus sp. SRB_331]RAN84987.1 hypothetical protein B5P42_02860 [Bacillus sp. SRB_331]
MSIYTNELILETLAEMKYYGKQINEGAFSRERPQLLAAIKDNFGTLESALSQVTPIKIQPRKMTKKDNIYTWLAH